MEKKFEKPELIIIFFDGDMEADITVSGDKSIDPEGDED